MIPADDVKDQHRKHWNVSADGWAVWLKWIERNYVSVAEWLKGAAHWEAGAHILDVACGAGYPALTAAERVQPGGRVVATDLSASNELSSNCRRSASISLKLMLSRPRSRACRRRHRDHPWR
jgi:cyclopropane fatty-acyl-phospholipid synthase-like methyltransferase